MKKCPYCGHGNDEQAKTCEHCFAELPVEKQTETEPNTTYQRDCLFSHCVVFASLS